MSSIDQVSDMLAARWARSIEYTKASLEIAAAIRKAVAEEREACYQIAVKENAKYLNFVAYTGSGYIARNVGMNVSFHIMEDICGRSEKAAPEETDAAVS